MGRSSIASALHIPMMFWTLMWLALASTPLWASDEILHVGGDVKAPEMISKIDPIYPEEARRQHLGGNVILEVVIDTDGSVTDAHVIKSIPLLDAAALEAVKQWKYRPATQGGTPVRVHYSIILNFSPDGASPSPNPPAPETDKPRQVTGNVVPPRLVTKITPEYPEDVRRKRVEGDVALQADIDTDGNVENVSVLRSVPELDEYAVAAVKQWKYEPATVNGRPVRVQITVVVNFSLRKSS